MTTEAEPLTGSWGGQMFVDDKPATFKQPIHDRTPAILVLEDGSEVLYGYWSVSKVGGRVMTMIMHPEGPHSWDQPRQDNEWADSFTSAYNRMLSEVESRFRD